MHAMLINETLLLKARINGMDNTRTSRAVTRGRLARRYKQLKKYRTQISQFFHNENA